MNTTLMTAHRQIHLDFHTPAGVTVGDRFHATEFFDTLEAAKINSIAVFAKCHHGYPYFNTKVETLSEASENQLPPSGMIPIIVPSMTAEPRTAPPF
jgi:hypothetical protein